MERSVVTGREVASEAQIQHTRHDARRTTCAREFAGSKTEDDARLVEDGRLDDVSSKTEPAARREQTIAQ